MRIEQLTVKNFKGFEDCTFSFHPEFNLLVGKNGTGKTSILDALAVAVGSWFLGIDGADTRHIRPNEVMLKCFEYPQDGYASEKSFEAIYPCEVNATGQLQDQHISWQRSLKEGGRTTYKNALQIKTLSEESYKSIHAGEAISLPLISYYGTGRLWQEPREAFKVTGPQQLTEKKDRSRLAGYRNSIEPRLSVAELTQWIALQSWITFQQQGRVSPTFKAAKEAMLACLENAEDLYFDAKLEEVVVKLEKVIQPFSNLSDGQRCMLALVGDMAQKAAKLNPQYGDQVLKETTGIVLIDELDLHLHPVWQRRIIEDLRLTFPKIQFFCTSHSPFLIQSLRSGEELLLLDGQATANLANKPIEEIAQGLMGVENPQVSLRYENMKEAAKHYLEELETADKTPEEKLEAFKERLAEGIAPYADNPAYQAFLEMKRAVKLGE